jgi:hypothetical protein
MEGFPVAKATPTVEVVERLAMFFRRNGYVRWMDSARRKREGELYKKGMEVRLAPLSVDELTEVRRLLKRAGFKLARPFAKDSQWRQPVYGVAEVARFLSLVGEKAKRR